MLERAFSLAIFVLAVVGLYLQSGLREGKFRRHMFIFYTNLSNAAMAVYHGMLFAASFVPKSGLYAALTHPTVRYCATLAIWITHIIYHFVLLPHFKRHPDKYENDFLKFGNLCVHYIVPLLTVLEWFLCADKGVRPVSILIWIAIPLSYFFFCLIRARIFGAIGSGTSRYPYAFMDLDALGLRRWSVNMVLATVFYVALALILYGAAILLR